MIWKTTLALLAALFLSLGVSAQSCPQNNINVVELEFRKPDGTVFQPTDDFPTGTPINGTIYAKFGGSTTNAADLAARYTIYVNDVMVETRTVCLFEDVFVPKDVFEYIGDFQWNWGDKLEIKNIFMRWQTGNTNKTCPSLDDTSSNAQCYGNPEGFIVRTPLVANFNLVQDCDSYVVSFTNLTTGVYPETSGYTYNWVFKDQNGATLGTSTAQNPTYNFTSSGNYQTTLSSSDGQLTKSLTKDFYVFEPGEAAISYASSLCSIDGTAAVTQTGVTGGEFSSSSTNLKINSSTGEIDITNSIAGTYTIIYSFSDNGCDYTTDTLVTINDPAAPTGDAAQSFCSIDNSTVADLMASGDNIQWYADATGGSALDSSTALEDNTTYYASQTVGTCESDERFAVTVTVQPAPNAGTN
ncbi:MAG: hypothetical protein ACQEWG_15725, partial [Bacteroidota bacterium]